MPEENDVITLAHGAGGGAMTQLIEEVFLRAFSGELLIHKEDQARIPMQSLCDLGDRLALTTDSYVVNPIEFPGGDIGKLAVCGTLNDLAVGGAKPLYLSVGFILEEGLSVSILKRIVRSMADTANASGVQILTGDTKVVEQGKADKLFINTTGIGVINSGTRLSIDSVRSGDQILVNGYVGDHGAAVMLARDDLGLRADIRSDCADLSSLILAVLEACPGVRCLRDATRGGLASVLCDIAKASTVGVEIDEALLPVREATQGVCELLGLEPWFLANEGMVAIAVAPEDANEALRVMQRHPLGKEARCIGKVNEHSNGQVILNTVYGGKRILDMPHGLQLPRIC